MPTEKQKRNIVDAGARFVALAGEEGAQQFVNGVRGDL
jgi:hypothetical protein